MNLSSGKNLYWLIPGLLSVWFFTQCHPQPYKQGEVLYRYYCANCHMDDGSGLGKLFPPLSATTLHLGDPALLVCLIQEGKPVNPTTGQQMPANLALSDAEMTNLINFLGNKYVGLSQTVQIQDVRKWMTSCHDQ